MRRLRFVGAGLFLLGAFSAACADVSITPLQGESAAAGGLPTMGDLQADFDDARYTVCEQKIGRVLGADPPPSAADRAVLLSLRGECLLQQKEGLLAAQAFEGAAEAAPDKTDSAVAYATSQVIKRSANYAYKPATGKDRTPLPIQKKEKRGPALAAMFADELAKLTGSYESALKQTEAQNVLDFAPAIAALMKLELGSTRANAQTSAMQKGLAARVRELVDGSMTSMSTDADAICAEASKMVDVQAVENRPSFRRRKGLTDEDKGKIKDMLASCDKILGTLKDAGKALPVVGADGFKADVATEDALQNRLHGILTGNYRLPPKVGPAK